MHLEIIFFWCFHQAISLLSNSRELLPHIFLITDGCVEDERNICNSMRVHVTTHLHISPRISTFGIGKNLVHDIFFFQS